VQFQRPSTTTIVGGGKCSCHEMLEEIRPLLVTDADSDNLQEPLPDLPAPALYWNNLFNYYCTVDDPSDRFYSSPIWAVRREGRAKSTDDLPGSPELIERRRPLNKFKVTRKTHQGEFDNIHLAPRMTLNPAYLKVGDVRVDIADSYDHVKQWKLDSIP